MECFNSLLLKLREVHEREVEGWQMKIQELSNKKGCDTKRMEELFTKNQQMKEQQKLLTENIKTLENRLRAGLCDRCTVTQEVAKRRQQEFEASQIQSLQHISLMAGEMNNLKKENKRLRDDIKLLKAALQGGHMDRSSSISATTEVQPNSSPDLSPTPKPMALISMATGAASIQPVDGDVAVKTEADQRSEEAEYRQWSSVNRGHNDSYMPLSTLASSSAWKTEHNGAHVGERSSEMTHSRHVVHAPVPCRPQPVKTSPVALPWPSVPVGNLLLQPPPKPSQPRFPNLIASGQHGGPRRHTLGSLWHKQSAPKPGAAEPTVLFRLRNLSEHVENQTRPQEKPEITPAKAERVSGEGQREVCDGPLDLSDHGKSKSGQSPRDYSSLALKGTERGQSSPERPTKANPLTHGPAMSPVKQQGDEPTGDQKHKVSSKQEEEVNRKTEQSGEKKVPVLTISLRPVVVLETLNSALQKQESLSTSEKSSPTAEMLSSGNEKEKEKEKEKEEEEKEKEKESSQGYKRKRTEQTEADMDGIQQERKIKITVRAEEQSPNLH